MSFGKKDYYAEGLSESFDEHGIVATVEQIRAVAADVELYVENEGMAFYSPPASDYYNDVERQWKIKYEALQKQFDAYVGNAETAVKRISRMHSDANISIGQYGEVTRYR